MGRLKHSGDSSSSANHFWVMTLDPKFRDVDFWEPMNNKHYRLCNRIEYNDIMRKYMKGELESQQQISDAIKKRNTKDKGAANKNEG